LRLGRGSPARADAAARRALEADEYLIEAPLVIEQLYRAAFALARMDSASAWCARGAARFPDEWRFVDCQLTMMAVSGGDHPDPARAWQLQEQVSQLDPPDAARASGRPYYPLYRRLAVAGVLARAGLRDSARAVLESVRRDVGTDGALARSFFYDEAALRYLLNDPADTVLALLARYVHENPRYREYLRNDVHFGKLRRDSRYQALLRDPSIGR
ncbi:MAG TPA: hypothetical protein VFH27_05690, partial [Longimicrobiaceae bacterium]|nr:hypothetical protein [Longimicrobiaceae bacterium]